MSKIAYSFIIELKGVGKVITYAGMLYYEKDGVEDLVTFTAAKKLNALIKVHACQWMIMICNEINFLIIVYHEKTFSC